jgi:Zinc knuckle
MPRKNPRTPAPREEPETSHETVQPESEAMGAAPADDPAEPASDSEMGDADPPQELTQAEVSIPETTIRPPTSSSNSSSDAEIRRSRQELRALKRQQTRLELRLKIDETRRTVSRLQSSFGDDRGGKRPRADTLQVSVHDRSRSQSRSRQASEYEVETSDSEESASYTSGQRRPDQELFTKAPPRLKLEPKYAGKSLRDYTIFMARLDNHFERYAGAYTHDRQKIADAVAELDDDMLRKWVQHKKDIDVDNLTWSGFCDFQLSLINDPVNMTREAMRKYMTAAQKPEQSVRDFAAYLKEWEQLLDPYTEEQRKEHLRAKVLYEVRAESLKYSKEPKSYDAYVAHLQTVEDSIWTRRAALKGKKPRGAARITPHSASTTREERSTERSERPERPDRKSSRTRFVCYYCNQPGHRSTKCSKRMQDEKNRKEGTNSKN